MKVTIVLFNKSLLLKISKKDQDLFVKVVDILNILSKPPFVWADGKLNFTYSCHSICNLVAWAIPELTHVYGNFLGIVHLPNSDTDLNLVGCKHSWLQTPDLAIIDPIPVGLVSCNPILIGNKSMYEPYGKNFYRPSDEVRCKVANRKNYREALVLIRRLEKLLG